MTRIIEIIVAPDGKSRVETKGFTGSECRDASRFLEEALGHKTGDQTTAEFHQTPQTQQSHLHTS